MEQEPSPDGPGNQPVGLLKKKKVIGCFCVVFVLTAAACFWAGIEFAAYAIRLDRLVVEHFKGKSRQFPARIYARPLELYPGLTLEADAFFQELSLLRYQSSGQLEFPGSLARSGNVFDLFTRPFKFEDGEEPRRKIRVVFNKRDVVSVTDTDSQTPLDLFRLEPVCIGALFSDEQEDRIPVTLEETPPLLINTLLAVEDREFYSHRGVDVSAVVRAIIANIRKRRMAQGASTLTQQLVRSLFLTRSQTLDRKIDEAVMAIALETHYDKNEILSAYINEVYLGQSGNRAVCGFGLASRHYFGRGLNELRSHETALLVGLLKGPSHYSPGRYPERAKRRRNTVLNIMAERGIITREEADTASREAIEIIRDTSRDRTMFPACLEAVQRGLAEEYDRENLHTKGLRIFTSIDPLVQLRVERAAGEELKSIESRHRLEKGQLEIGIVVVSAQGELLAIVGGRDFRFRGFNRALDAMRPIGSLVKPAVYLTALGHPEKYGLTTLLDDSPIKTDDGEGGIWSPKNFDRVYHGRVPLYRALARSYNSATVRLGMELGLDDVFDTIGKLGMEREIQSYPSSLLGTMSMSPMEVAIMYQTLAQGGFHSPVRVIRGVYETGGDPVRRYPLNVRRNFEPGPVFLVNMILEKVLSEGTAVSASALLGSEMRAAGKTGTTDDLRDSWFAGFTGDCLTVVWIGRDDYKSTRLTGADGALQVWGRIMTGISRQSLDLPVPDTVTWARVDPDAGGLVEESCEYAITMPYIKGFAPTETVPCRGIENEEEPKEFFFKRWLRKLF